MKKANVRIPLPRVSQKFNYDCGAAALKSLYEFENPDDTNDLNKYISLLDSDEKSGTNTHNMRVAIKLLGLKMVEYKNMSLKRLIKEIITGNPVLCLIRSNDHGHFVIAIGCDNEHIYFEDPFKKKNNGYLKHDEFFRRWSDGDPSSKLARFGMVIRSGYAGDSKTTKASKITGD